MDDQGNYRQRIGPALVAEGIIDAAQLKLALTCQDDYPHYSLGQIIAAKFSLPMKEVDRVLLKSVVMPMLVPELMNRLDAFAAKDKFSRRMDVGNFVTRADALPLCFETDNVSSRFYKLDPENAEEPATAKRYSRTTVTALVTLTTVDDQTVRAKIHAAHNSLEKRLAITDDDETLRSGVYFELRNAYKSFLNKE